MGFEYAIKVLREVRIPELLYAKEFLKRHGIDTIAITAIEEKVERVKESIKFLEREIKEMDEPKTIKDRKGIKYVKVDELSPALYEKIKEEIVAKRLANEKKRREREKKREETRSNEQEG